MRIDWTIISEASVAPAVMSGNTGRAIVYRVRVAARSKPLSHDGEVYRRVEDYNWFWVFVQTGVNWLMIDDWCWWASIVQQVHGYWSQQDRIKAISFSHVHTYVGYISID